jgi:hypothetical protein
MDLGFCCSRKTWTNNDTVSKNTPVTTFAGGTDWKQVACGQIIQQQSKLMAVFGLGDVMNRVNLEII